MAFFHRGIDAKDFEHPRDRLAAIVSGVAQKEGLASEPDRKAIEAAASHTLDLIALPSVYAKGVDLAETQKALQALKAVKPADAAGRVAAERAALEQVAGWSVMGVDETPAKVAKIVKE